MQISEEYEKIFGKLPEHIQLLAQKLVVKQIVAAAHSKKLDAASDTVTRLRNELGEMAEEIDIIKVELRDACEKHAKENL